jgi:peptide/nickel transport system substrate-binding protein
MNNVLRRVAFVAPAAAVSLALAACGSSNSGGSAQSPSSQSLSGKRGGMLTILSHQDFEHLDPGQSYFVTDYNAVYATGRPLFSNMPNNPTTARPDLAAGPAQVSPDGLTVTIHIRPGVRFSPPVNRAVTSADVAYAIERAANPNVANPYFQPYFGNLVGFAKASGGPFPGVTTPDSSTIVFHLTKPTPDIVIGALGLPISVPVPPEFAKPLDAMKPTAYGSKYLVSTGPYMFKSDSKGMFLGIGYQPGKSATLVRNPNWSASTDFRPAYLDQINVNIGGDTSVIGRQVLTGSHMVQSDPPSNDIVKLAAQKYPKQITVTQGTGVLYVTLDNKKGPFTNVNLRRAVWAELDRAAMVKAAGGAAYLGPVGTHFIYPTTEGFAQAGGLAGPQVDYNKYPSGNLSVAEKYMKLAGYPSGKYTGAATVKVVGSTGGPNPAYAQITNRALQTLGFHTNFNLVDQSVMYAKYCGVPAQEIDVCPNVGWVRDFSDPQTAIDAPFNGKYIVPTNNSNWGQVDDPTINKMMDAAEGVTGTAAREQAWANVDRALVDAAVAVPFNFTYQPEVESRDVNGISMQWNDGAWDLAFTSLK